MKKPRSRLRLLLDTLEEDHDRIILDRPPDIALLSENVFRASERILVPMIPTTLSERTLEQLFEFFTGKELPAGIIAPISSMAQTCKRTHQENIEKLRQK